MKYLFRLDDISPDMNWEKFNKVINLFNKNKISVLLGIIPNNKDPMLNYSSNVDKNKFFELVINLTKVGHLISQHGYNHVYHTTDSGMLGINDRSEFAGLCISEQIDKIKLGKKILSEYSLISDIWMAPSHSFDRVTLVSLNKEKFNFVTDGYSLYPYKRRNLIFIPCQSSKPIKPKWLPGVNTVCLHTNLMTDKDIDNLDEFIKRYNNRIISFNYYLLNLGKVSKLSSYCQITIEFFILKLRKIIKIFKYR